MQSDYDFRGVYMSIEIYALVNQKVASFRVNGSSVHELGMYAHILKSLDVIYQVSISKDYLIVTTEDPSVRSGRWDPSFPKDRPTNNINAYDWSGNHQWNIAEIVGDIKASFWGGTVTTKDLIANHAGIDTSKIDENHEFYCCTATNSYLYLIDLTDRRLIQIVQTK
jgi:hypothetical protein